MSDWSWVEHLLLGLIGPAIALVHAIPQLGVVVVRREVPHPAAVIGFAVLCSALMASGVSPALYLPAALAGLVGGGAFGAAMVSAREHPWGWPGAGAWLRFLLGSLALASVKLLGWPTEGLFSVWLVGVSVLFLEGRTGPLVEVARSGAALAVFFASGVAAFDAVLDPFGGGPSTLPVLGLYAAAAGLVAGPAVWQGHVGRSGAVALLAWAAAAALAVPLRHADQQIPSLLVEVWLRRGGLWQDLPVVGQTYGMSPMQTCVQLGTVHPGIDIVSGDRMWPGTCPSVRSASASLSGEWPDGSLLARVADAPLWPPAGRLRMVNVDRENGTWGQPYVVGCPSPGIVSVPNGDVVSLESRPLPGWPSNGVAELDPDGAWTVQDYIDLCGPNEVPCRVRRMISIGFAWQIVLLGMLTLGVAASVHATDRTPPTATVLAPIAIVPLAAMMSHGGPDALLIVGILPVLTWGTGLAALAIGPRRPVRWRRGAIVGVALAVGAGLTSGWMGPRPTDGVLLLLPLVPGVWLTMLPSDRAERALLLTASMGVACTLLLLLFLTYARYHMSLPGQSGMLPPPVLGVEVAIGVNTAVLVAVSRGWSWPWRAVQALTVLSGVGYVGATTWWATRSAPIDTHTLPVATQLPAARYATQVLDPRSMACVGTDDGRVVPVLPGTNCALETATWLLPAERRWVDVATSMAAGDFLAVRYGPAWGPRRWRIGMLMLHMAGPTDIVLTDAGPGRGAFRDGTEVSLSDPEALGEALDRLGGEWSIELVAGDHWTVADVVTACESLRTNWRHRCALPWPGESE